MKSNDFNVCECESNASGAKYPAIFATLHSIKFDTKMFFTPRANWLLKDNNLLQILNGQYGELKTIVSENDKKIAQNTKALVKKELESISSKEDAIQFAVKHSSRAELETSDAAKEFMNTWNFTIQDFVKAGGKNG